MYQERPSMRREKMPAMGMDAMVEPAAAEGSKAPGDHLPSIDRVEKAGNLIVSG